MSGPGRVIIVGGGIAGIAAAVRLAERGVRVTLLETRKKLGGRATSFLDSRSGERLDNCQHVVLGCCTNFLDLLRRLGADSLIRWHDRQHWVEAGGRVSVVRPGVLPAPLHYAGSVVRARFLSLAERAALGRAAAMILAADRAEHTRETFAEFLGRCGQSPRLVRRFWSPIVVSACNFGVERVAASTALHVFQEGFLASPRAGRIGVPGVPLLELYDRALGVITTAGGEVLLGTAAATVGETYVTTTGGERLDAGPRGRVILAVPVERAARVADAEVRGRDPRFGALGAFTHSPIVGVHVRFDRPVLPLPHAVLVDRATQWVFRKDEAGERIHAVVSAAEEWVELSEEEIVARVLADIGACFPAAAGARVVSARAVKERFATFAPAPGIDEARPAATHPASRLILAGDYTATGWPATMEGAARSGYAAAAAALGLGTGAMTVAGLTPGVIARVVMRL